MTAVDASHRPASRRSGDDGTATPEPTGKPVGRHERMTGSRWIVWTLLVLGGLVMLFPIYWVLVTAVSPGGIVEGGGIFPTHVDLGVFAQAFHDQPLGTWMINSILVSGGSVVLSVVISLLAGYGFAKYRFRGKGSIFALMLVTIMVPIQVIIVPEFVIVSTLHLVNSNWAVILPGAAQAITIFMARQFLSELPDELIEAARVDGASELRIFLRVVLPLSGPLIAVITILTFVWRWNDFLWPLVVLQTTNKFTMSVGLSSLNGAYSHPWDQVMAVTLVSMIPVLVVFLAFQRQFVAGIADSGLKG